MGVGFDQAFNTKRRDRKDKLSTKKILGFVIVVLALVASFQPVTHACYSLPYAELKNIEFMWPIKTSSYTCLHCQCTFSEQNMLIEHTRQENKRFSTTKSARFRNDGSLIPQGDNRENEGDGVGK